MKELWPLVELGDGADTPTIVGALYHPDDGHIAPADLTMALRKGARSARRRDLRAHRGHRRSTRTASGEWQVRTNKGEIIAPSTWSAPPATTRAQTGRMFGLNVPAIPVEHQYIVYDESPELKAYRAGRRPRAGGAARIRPVLLPARGAHGLDPRSLREGRAGALRRRRAGLVRQGACSPGDLDRLVPHVEAAMRRVPALENCGIKDIVNGPISYTPDGSPLIGPAWGVQQRVAQRGPQLRHHRRRRLRLAAGRVDRRGRAGHRHAGGRSAPLRRLHQQALRREEERGDLPQRLHHPLPGRGARRRAAGQDEPGVRQARARMGAVWGQRYGWERANWFAPAGRRAQGPVELPAHQLLRARRQRSAG